jgi:RimJ/RimL family protein N-acetyltransferase
MSSVPRRRGPPIEVLTDRFQLRSLAPVDAAERWLSWSVDPDVMGPLNTPIRPMTRRELEAYIAGFDNENSYLIGIFTRSDRRFIGFYMITIDRQHLTANFNVLIGEKDYWGHKVVNETRAVILDFLFRKRGIEKAFGRPLARNFPAVFNYQAQGWRLEGVLRGQVKSVIDGSRLDQYHFGMLATEWLARPRAASR